MNLPRDPEIAAAEDAVLAARGRLAAVVAERQPLCPHTSVLQLYGVSRSRRICQQCGLEEESSHWSGLTTDHWSRHDFRPGALGNADHRAVRITNDQGEFYGCRVRT